MSPHDEDEGPEPAAPPPTWMQQQIEKAATVQPMTEEEYGHLLRPPAETDQKLLGKIPLLERIPPSAALYLGSLRACPAEHMARAASKVSAQQVAAWRRTIRGFAELELEAFRDAGAALVAACYDRAVNGYLKPVYQLKKLVGYERVYSDKLAEILLKGMNKEMFRPEPEKTAGPERIILGTPEQVAEVVRRLSPTSQPKTIEAETK